MRGTQLWKHRTGAGARNDDMDNTCELLIKVVSAGSIMNFMEPRLG
ncbi:hypothetical protein [Desulfonema limicola]|nr:hypothetical protein [Desulfonema limicola]